MRRGPTVGQPPYKKVEAKMTEQSAMKSGRVISASVALLVLIGTAFGHAHLQKAAPADGSTISRAPPNVVLTFSEAARLTAAWIQKGEEPKQKLAPLPDQTAVEVTIPLPALSPGGYVVSWRALSADGHVMPGQIRFTISPDKAGAASKTGTSTSAHVIETDPSLLRCMLSNLVSNAIRYTAHGEVRVMSEVEPDENLCLAVSDTGIEIPESELTRVFDDFHRLPEAERTVREGFGLGLGIVRRLSAALGCPVDVRSALGRGSTFRIEIPAGKVCGIA